MQSLRLQSRFACGSPPWPSRRSAPGTTSALRSC
jgi:hypothetical protein